MAYLDELISALAKAQKEEIEMQAIWLNRPILVRDGIKVKLTSKLTEGVEIEVRGGKLKEDPDNFTHKIIGCFGKMDQSFLYINLINNATLELSRVVLKEDK